MKSFELLITILFVTLIWMIVVKGMSLYSVMSFMAVLFVVLFIGFDLGKIPLFNSLNVFAKKKCKRFCGDSDSDSDSDSDYSDSDYSDSDAVEEPFEDIKVQRSTKETEKKVPKKFKDVPTPDFKSPEPLMYDEYKYRENLFPDISCGGDHLIAEKMKHMGTQPKVSIDSQGRVNKYTNYGYLAEELNSHANSIWWDDETLEDEF